MKWNFTVPYVREFDSLFHYPEQSRVTGLPINWYAGDTSDGYHGTRVFGEHTLELHGMPKGRTPEYMQERLRRFFAKFGPVVHCRAEPHGLDPYQCDGVAYVSFRDRATALKALAAPLRFPSSLHDKVIHMRHLDSDKTNDPDYGLKAKFWDSELISLARQLHIQLCKSEEWRENGKPLAIVSHGLFEREKVNVDGAANAPPPTLRGGIPLPRKTIFRNTPTRLVPARDAIRQRFGSWGAFLSEPPFDKLFRMDVRGPTGATPVAGETEIEADPTSTLVVFPRLISIVQRTRLLARARMALQKRLHDEFSLWWREGKIPLPEYTKRRVVWWDHTPKLPFDLQIQSRSSDRHRIFDERFIYRMQLARARNLRKKEGRAVIGEERNKKLAEKKERLDARREQSLSVIQRARCSALVGKAIGSTPPSTPSRRL